MMNSALLYNICTIGYFIALFIYIANLAAKRARLRKLATVVAALAFLAQTFGMVLRWMEAGNVEVAAMERASSQKLTGIDWLIVFTQHPPWSNLYEIMVYMSWGIVLVFLVTEVKWRIRFIGIFALLLALTALGMASLTDGMIKPLVPALKSWWIMVHVISASIAYAAGTIGAVVSLFYLIKAKDRITLTSIAMGTMGVSLFLLILLGRVSALFLHGTYRVKLVRAMGGDEINVGQFIDDKFVPYYVPSPYVGLLLIIAIVLCLAAFMLLWRRRLLDDVPSGIGKVLYFLATLATMGVVIVAIGNDLFCTTFNIPSDVASQLMPPGPWKLSLRSHTWDLGLFAVILIAQIFIGLCFLYPKKIRYMLPPENNLDRTAYATIMVSFALVAVVLVTGALWAHYAWGRYWAWDPKETGALIIWLTYALYLHTRVTYGWAGVRSAVIGIFAFFVILAGFLGVNLGFFAEGLHSYGSS